MLSITDTVSTCLWVHRKGDYVIDSCWVRLRVNFTVARMGLSLRLKYTVLHVLTRMLICPHCKKNLRKSHVCTEPAKKFQHLQLFHFSNFYSEANSRMSSSPFKKPISTVHTLEFSVKCAGLFR